MGNEVRIVSFELSDRGIGDIGDKPRRNAAQERVGDEGVPHAVGRDDVGVEAGRLGSTLEQEIVRAGDPSAFAFRLHEQRRIRWLILNDGS